MNVQAIFNERGKRFNLAYSAVGVAKEGGGDITNLYIMAY